MGAKTPRPARAKQLPNAMRSSYVKWIVGLHEKVVKAEEEVSNYMFSALDSEWDVVYAAVPGDTVMRSPMESLRPEIAIHVHVISAWSNVLNYEERYRRKGTMPRLFCSPMMLWKDDYEASEETRRIHFFKENMDSVLQMTESKSIKEVKLVQIPMHYSDHFYLLSFNMITFEIVLIDNIDSTEEFAIRYHGCPEKMRDAFSWYVKSVSPVAAANILKSKPTVLDIPWKTTKNGIDCGVFLMRHMETYMGSLKDWRCCFSPEFNSKGELSAKQGRELDDLRRKYIAKILLCDINRSKHVVEAGVSKYMGLSESYRMQLDGRVHKKILRRLNSV